MNHIGRVLFFMNGWSSVAGGIQTVNRELACALARLQSDLKITVLCPNASDAEIKHAHASGVELVSAGAKKADDWLAVALSPELAAIDAGSVRFVVGHSYFSGEHAKTFRDRFFRDAKCAQFIHHSPLHVERFKEYRRDAYVLSREDKVKEEIELAQKADLVICIGPRLHRITIDNLTPRGRAKEQVKRIDCGISRLDLTNMEEPVQPTLLCLGRSESLGVKGLDIFAYMAGYILDAWHENPATLGKTPPRFIVRGAQEAPELLEEKLRALARETGDLEPAIFVRPYSTDPVELDADYKSASIFVMPSREEGFGLVACEAISRGVPILISQETGLAELIQEIEHANSLQSHCLVDMKGDPKSVARAFANKAMAILTRQAGRQRYFQILREHLLAVASWDVAAEQFLDILQGAGLNAPKPVTASLMPVVRPGVQQPENIKLLPVQPSTAVGRAAEKKLGAVDLKIRRRFLFALMKSPPAVSFLSEMLSLPDGIFTSREHAAMIFDRLLSEDLDEALAMLARAHREFEVDQENDPEARVALKSAIRTFVELTFEESIIAALRPQALGLGVFMELPAKTITGAEIIEARFHNQPVKFAETTAPDGDSSTRPGRPRGAFTVPMPPTAGADTLDSFAPSVITWMQDRFSYNGEELGLSDIRKRLKNNIIREKRRYYFIVNAPEWSVPAAHHSSRWHRAYMDKLRTIVEELNALIPEIAFFSLSQPTGKDANEETNKLQSVFNLLYDDGGAR